MESLPPILRLPDEILDQILSSACQTPPRPLGGLIWEHKLPSTVLSIALTCSRFSGISRFYIYESIHIKPVLPCRPSVLPAVHARFRDEPELRLRCRKLQLEISSISKKHYAMVSDLLRWLGNVRYLSLAGYFAFHKLPDSSTGRIQEGDDDDELRTSHDMWMLIGLVNRHMRSLELLDCFDQPNGGCEGYDLVSNINIPSLKTLQVVRLATSTKPLGADKQRTAPFTNLALSILNATPEMVSQFISWPEKLTKFRLYTTRSGIYRIDMPMIQSCLQPHKTTLKYIRIDEIYVKQRLDRPLGFEATQFSRLKQLHLSRWLWSEHLDLEMARAEAELLLAPNLRKFVWDFSTLSGDLPMRYWPSFGAKEEEWLKIFAHVVISQRDRCCLEEIRIQFTLDIGEQRIQFTPEDIGEKEEYEVYPWDRMHCVREEVARQSGGLVTLTYSDPVFSREKWANYLKWLRKKEMGMEARDT